MCLCEMQTIHITLIGLNESSPYEFLSAIHFELHFRQAFNTHRTIMKIYKLPYDLFQSSYCFNEAFETLGRIVSIDFKKSSTFNLRTLKGMARMQTKFE